jgi:hypothetical protein
MQIKVSVSCNMKLIVNTDENKRAEDQNLEIIPRKTTYGQGNESFFHQTL